MKRAIFILIVALAALALPGTASAGVELGQCEPVAKGAGLYEGSACLALGGKKNHEWLELTGALGEYADGEEDIRRDEPQIIKGGALEMKCWETTNGHATSFTTNEQVVHLWYCEELKPTKAKCSNRIVEGTEEEIELLPSTGTFTEISETVVHDQFASYNATFECGGVPASIEGSYECNVGYRSGANKINLLIHIYDCQLGPSYGAQELHMTIGLVSAKVEDEGEQEDRWDKGETRLVVRTDPHPGKKPRRS